MSPNAVEPGTRLVDRYRLEEHLGGGGRHDVLAGPGRAAGPAGRASACSTEAQAEQAERVLRAARRAAVLTDPRFLRVLDASRGRRRRLRRQRVGPRDQPGRPAGRRTAAAGRGPRRWPWRSPTRSTPRTGRAWRTSACSPSTCCAPATARSRSAGWRSTPPSAASSRPAPSDAARRDAEGAAAIVYAALTARWPGGPGTGLAAAPHDGRRTVQPPAGAGRRPARPRPSSCRRAAASPAPGAARGRTPGGARRRRSTTRTSRPGSRSCGRPAARAPAVRHRPARAVRAATTTRAGRAAEPRPPCWPGARGARAVRRASRWPAAR